MRLSTLKWIEQTPSRRYIKRKKVHQIAIVEDLKLKQGVIDPTVK